MKTRNTLVLREKQAWQRKKEMIVTIRHKWKWRLL